MWDSNGKEDRENKETTPPVYEAENSEQSGEQGDDDSLDSTLEGDLAALQKQLEEEKAKTEDSYNRLLRLQADFDNYRRRTQTEKEEFFKYATESVMLALLPVLDNFQLALEAKENDPAKVVEGVEMIYRQMLDVLQKEGLSVIEALGGEFDPEKHEAVMQEPAGDKEDNTVTQELRRGYCLKEKVIRPTMVVVAKA